jgi:CelD/BcsL family acetyltransferase involved in cellulose biosynthesis
VQIDVVRPGELTQADIARWCALQAEGQDLESPFLSPHWARAVEQAQTTELSNVRVALLHEAGVVRGFFPAKVQGGVAMPAGAPMCDYQGLVAEAGVEVAPRDLVAALGVGRYDFSHLPQSQALFAPHLRGVSPSWIVRLPFGYDVYATDKNQESGVLKDLDKRRRKAERELGKVTFTAFSRSRADFDRMLEWKREQYRKTGQTDIFQAGWTVRLLRDLFQSRDPDFGGALFTLHIGDELAAVHFHLRGGQVIHAWMIAHDEAFDKVSPGLLLFQDIMRWMDDTPYTSIDFGPGDYRFKKQLSNAACMVGHGFVGRLGPSTLVRQAAYGIREVAERLPLGPVSELPGKAMRRLDLIRGLR